MNTIRAARLPVGCWELLATRSYVFADHTGAAGSCSPTRSWRILSKTFRTKANIARIADARYAIVLMAYQVADVLFSKCVISEICGRPISRNGWGLRRTPCCCCCIARVGFWPTALAAGCFEKGTDQLRFEIYHARS